GPDAGAGNRGVRRGHLVGGDHAAHPLLAGDGGQPAGVAAGLAGHLPVGRPDGPRRYGRRAGQAPSHAAAPGGVGRDGGPAADPGERGRRSGAGPGGLGRAGNHCRHLAHGGRPADGAGLRGGGTPARLAGGIAVFRPGTGRPDGAEQLPAAVTGRHLDLLWPWARHVGRGRPGGAGARRAGVLRAATARKPLVAATVPAGAGGMAVARLHLLARAAASTHPCVDSRAWSSAATWWWWGPAWSGWRPR